MLLFYDPVKIHHYNSLDNLCWLHTGHGYGTFCKIQVGPQSEPQTMMMWEKEIVYTIYHYAP